MYETKERLAQKIIQVSRCRMDWKMAVTIKGIRRSSNQKCISNLPRISKSKSEVHYSKIKVWRTSLLTSSKCWGWQATRTRGWRIKLGCFRSSSRNVQLALVRAFKRGARIKMQSTLTTKAWIAVNKMLLSTLVILWIPSHPFKNIRMIQLWKPTIWGGTT